MSGIIGGAGSKSGIIGQTELEYEVGAYIPIVSGSDAGSGTLGLSSTTHHIRYVKVGKLVHIQAHIVLTGSGTFSGYLLVSLPFVVLNEDSTAANKNLNNSLITCFWSDHSRSNDTQTFGEVQRGTDVMYFGWRNSGGGASVFPIDHGSVDTDWQMRISGTYVAAN